MTRDPADDTPDLYARQSLRQTGINHSGGTQSPDVVPWGNEPHPDPALLASAASWATDPGVALAPGVPNYVYARVKNAAAQATPGRLFMGAAEPAFLCWPDTLVPLKSSANLPYIAVKVALDSVGVGLDGFVYCPSNSGATLAAWAYTLAHPVVPPVCDDVTALLAFLRSTPSYVQRSVGFGLVADAYRYRAGYKQRAVAAMMAFELAWEDCPLGWTLALQVCEGGSAIAIDPFDVTMDAGSRLARATLPAGYESVLEFSIDAHGIAPLPGTRIAVRVLLPVEQAQYPLGGHCWCAQSS